MPESHDEGDLVDRLIDELQNAQRDQRNARYLMSVLIALVVLVFIYLGVREIRLFQEEELDEFSIALGVEAADLAPVAAEGVGEALNRLGPVYQEAFTEVFNRDEEQYYAVLSDEYIGLQQYARQAWPAIEEAIAALVVRQEETASDELSRYIDRDKLADLSFAYHQALSDYLEELMAGQYAVNLEVSEDIIAKLNRIAEEETALSPGDTRYMIGMMLELLGLEMQAVSESESAPQPQS